MQHIPTSICTVEDRTLDNSRYSFIIRSTQFVNMGNSIVAYTQIVEVFTDGFVFVTSITSANMRVNTFVH